VLAIRGLDSVDSRTVAVGRSATAVTPVVFAILKTPPLARLSPGFSVKKSGKLFRHR
jgi:hypothetical protein